MLGNTEPKNLEMKYVLHAAKLRLLSLLTPVRTVSFYSNAVIYSEPRVKHLTWRLCDILRLLAAKYFRKELHLKCLTGF